MVFSMRVILAATSFAFISGALSPAVEAEDSITRSYSFPAPALAPDGRYVRGEMEGLPVAQTPGKPVLPIKPVSFLIPRGYTVSGVEVERENKVTLPGHYTVIPGSQPVPLNYDGPPPALTPDEDIYNSRSPYPARAYSDESVQNKGPYTILILALNPISYIPAKGEISYFGSVRLTVRLATVTRTLSGSLRRKPTAADEEFVSRKVENPEDLLSYAGTEEERTPSLSGGALADYPHVIITSQALENASGAYTFQDLAAHRTANGMASTIVTTEYIYANFDGTRPDGGSDNQTRTRNFISWARDNWGTQYVLLGGHSGTIPVRYLNANGTNLPADLYYGNLDGTFDNDADGIYGESNDGIGGGEVDLYAEVYVGRSAAENETDVANFVMKTLAYEGASGDYLHQAYMLGEHLGFGGVSEYAKDSMEEIKLGSCEHGYCTKGFTEDDFFQTSTLYDADGTWAKSQLVAIINGGVHILNHLGHANYTYDMKLYTSDLASLTNTDYYFAYSQGCMPGGFDTDDCFAEEVTTSAHGAFAVVMNSRYGYGQYNSTAGPSQYYDREFWDALFGEGIRELGRMNADSKEDNDFRVSDGYLRWCFYEINLFGDPATRIRNISSKGTVSFDAAAYPLPATVNVTVMDLDMDTDPNVPDTASIAVSSTTETTPENIVLTETGNSTRTFRGAFDIEPGAAVNGDTVVQAANGDTLTVVYQDADDGTGSPATAQDTAAVDSSGPVISNVACMAAAMSCVISWDTDEAADSAVRHGTAPPPSSETGAENLTTSHSLRITNLQPLTTYYTEVASEDGLGNVTTDDNGGSYYQFTTLERGAILFIDDDEGDPFESYFTDALDAGSYSYDVWDVSEEGSSPELDNMDDYGIVVWNCGYDYSSATAGLTDAEQNTLGGYLDGGGNAFLCGQDILYNGVSAAFRANYLHLASYDSDDTTSRATGIEDDPVSHGMDLPLSYPFTNYSDSLEPDPSSAGTFLTGGSTTFSHCATRYPEENGGEVFRIIFFAFPFEAISQTDEDSDNSATVMDRVIKFLAPIGISDFSPRYGLNDGALQLTIQGEGFAQELTASLGATALTVTEVTATQVTATVPAGIPAGPHNLEVKNRDSLRASFAARYTALDPASDDDLDGLTNTDEVLTHGTNPLLADSDEDGLIDGVEIGYGTNPLLEDEDGDGLTDYQEVNYNSGDGGYNPYDPESNPGGTDTDASNSDSDGDGFSDLVESCSGSDPLDSSGTPEMINVSFQPPSSTPPDGFAPDKGNSFSACGFGWQ